MSDFENSKCRSTGAFNEAEDAETPGQFSVCMLASTLVHVSVYPWLFSALNHFSPDGVWWIIPANISLLACGVLTLVLLGLLLDDLAIKGQKGKKS